MGPRMKCIFPVPVACPNYVPRTVNLTSLLMFLWELSHKAKRQFFCLFVFFKLLSLNCNLNKQLNYTLLWRHERHVYIIFLLLLLLLIFSLESCPSWSMVPFYQHSYIIIYTQINIQLGILIKMYHLPIQFSKDVFHPSTF